MFSKVTKETQDLTYLKWSHIRSSSGTAGTFLKSESIIDGVKTYYKLSNFDPVKGVIGHECVNELIVDRLLTILNVEHLNYKLINADIEIDGRVFNTFLCASADFKKKGESKIALDDFYRANANIGESRYDFCCRNDWREYIDKMIVIDYLILNRDRHGANIEMLRNSKAHTIRLAPLFDHGLSLLYSCLSEQAIANFDILEDKPCQNFIGSHSCFDNLQLIKQKPFINALCAEDKKIIFEDLENVISNTLIDKIWNMIYTRYQQYEAL